MAQLDVIHPTLKPVSTSLIVLALLAISLGWPARHHRSAWRDVATALAAAAVFAGLVFVVNEIGGQWRFLIFNRQRFLGTVATWMRPEPALSVEAVMERDGARELAEGARGGPACLVDRDAVDDARNLVLVVVDTWRADSLAAWGARRRLMPLFEQRAARSMVFRDVIANAPWTRPSMAAMLTGMTPEEAGVVGREDVLRAREVTVAEILKEMGFRTVGVVTNPHLFPGTGFEQGYDEYYQLARPRSYLPAGEVRKFFSGWAARQENNPQRTFFFVHLMDPHIPYLEPNERAPFFRRYDRKLYEEELRFFDEIFELFLNEVTSFFGPEVIMVITSDHGEEFGDHGRWGHGQSLYPELVRVPLLVQGKGLERGVIDARLEGRDAFHLLAGLASGKALDLAEWGRSYSRPVRTMSSYRRNAGTRWLPRPYRVVRKRGVEDGEWLLIRSTFGGVDELYHVASDPKAMTNELDRHPEIADRLWDARVGEIRGYRKPVRRAATEAELDRLRALGYVE